MKKISFFAIIFILLQVLFMRVPMDSNGAPTQPFTRWGTASLDGIALLDDYTISALIDGTAYTENRTFHNDGSFSLICPGQDTDNEICKNGGESGDEIFYFLERENRSYIAQETDLFSSKVGLADTPDLNFYSEDQPEALKINEIVFSPSDENNDFLYIFNPSNLLVDLENWRLEDSAGWQQPLKGFAAAESCTYVEFDNKNLDGAGGELKLAWYTNSVYVAGGDKWIVMDRVEWGEMDMAGRNTTLANYIGDLESTMSIKRIVNGTDTDDCSIDFIGMGKNSPRPRGQIKGKVTDVHGIPMANVLIKVLREGELISTEQTDTAGMFHIVLSAGIYELTVEKEGYYPVTEKEIELEAGGELFLSFRIAPVSREHMGILSGNVTGVEGPMSDVILSVMHISSSQIFTNITGSYGNYRFDLPAGIYAVTASMENYHSSEFKGIHIEAGIEIRLDISMVPYKGSVNNKSSNENSSISGNVVDTSGKALGGSIIRLKNLTSGDFTEIKCDELGHYSAEIIPGSYIFYVSHENYSENIKYIELESNVNKIINFVLSPFNEKANLICQVVDTEKNPIPFVDINIYREGIHLSQGWSNIEGLVFFEELSPGSISITAERAGYLKFVMDDIVIKADETPTLTLEMVGEEASEPGGDENEISSENLWDLYVVVFFVIVFILSLFGYIWLKKRGKKGGT